MPLAALAPGSVVVVRDEEWLVTAAEQTIDGWRLDVVGLSELVRETSATFYTGRDGDLDTVELLDPRQARLVPDASPRHRRTRLWLEATLRRTPMPVGEPGLTVADGMLVDRLDYQRRAVGHALSRNNLRPRILIADAVGLGKTLEIGMLLAELARRGRADRVLVVTPRHVLEQMQHELWCRFAIPLVRLDSDGVQRVRQHLPASRNPFTYYRRIIVSIDTLKSPRYRAYLEQHRWDVVVIDESHNVTNSGTLNNELARVLAPNTEALVLASATPHNGKKESFAELMHLLDPTAVGPDGEYDVADVGRLFVRRHRHSPEVAAEVGADWALRPEPQVLPVPASPAEDAVATELSQVWLYPDGPSPVVGKGDRLFPWTLAKAFLSSPAALVDTVEARLKRRADDSSADGERERLALERLHELAADALGKPSAKLDALVAYLQQIGVGAGTDTRAVLFAERVATLRWLAEQLPRRMGLKPGQVAVLHGGLPDAEQLRIVDGFKTKASPVRLLVTGDVASEGVNLHAQCHHLIHVDIPWSVIRLEQRNGRIDRYGQQHPPQITALALMPSDPDFGGDVRVLARLLAKEHRAHEVLGDAASLMQLHSATDEEKAVRRALAERRDLDTVVPDPGDDGLDLWDSFDGQLATTGEQLPPVPPSRGRESLFASDLAFLSESLAEAYADPASAPDDGNGTGWQGGGVGWTVYQGQGLVALRPPRDLRARLDALPHEYLAERKVRERMLLATSPAVARAQLTAAREGKPGGSTWPEAHFLSPLHPVLDWAADKVLAAGGRGEVPLVHGPVEAPRVLVLATLMNRRGQVVTRQLVTVEFPTGRADLPLASVAPGIDVFTGTGLLEAAVNPGPAEVTDELSALVPAAVDAAGSTLDLAEDTQQSDLDTRLQAWSTRRTRWRARAQQLEGDLAGSALAKVRRLGRRVSVEEEIAASLRASQRLLRPLVLVMPSGTTRADESNS